MKFEQLAQLLQRPHTAVVERAHAEDRGRDEELA
jgi:hypothetical protein